MFEWGIALQGLHSAHHRAATDAEKTAQTRGLIRKFARQARQGLSVLSRAEPSAMAPHAHGERGRQPAAQCVGVSVICCGHFPDGAEKFTPATLEGETKPEWHLRQMLGTANFRAGPVLALPPLP